MIRTALSAVRKSNEREFDEFRKRAIVETVNDELKNIAQV